MNALSSVIFSMKPHAEFQAKLRLEKLLEHLSLAEEGFDYENAWNSFHETVKSLYSSRTDQDFDNDAQEELYLSTHTDTLLNDIVPLFLRHWSRVNNILFRQDASQKIHSSLTCH
jgi:hypothetical protein